MILTVTLNPSVDMGYQLDELAIDGVSRVSPDAVSKTAGGKGLNVARVLTKLNQGVAATGFLGGNLGDFISQEITGIDIRDFFVRIDGDTRNCIALLHEGNQTEILEAGPEISTQEADDFLKQFSEQLKDVEVVTLSGSLPAGLPDDYYGKLIQMAVDAEKRVLLDTNGKLLKENLSGSSKPHLIKPNETELMDLTGIKDSEDESIVEALNAPIFADIPWVVVTQGSSGAIVKHDNLVYKATIPEVDVKNPVGSGDSVVAGLAAGFMQNLSGKSLIQYGLAMGVLNAMEEKTGDVNPELVDWCVGEITVEEM